MVTPKAPRRLCLKVMGREQHYPELIFLLRAGAGFVVAETRQSSEAVTSFGKGKIKQFREKRRNKQRETQPPSKEKMLKEREELALLLWALDLQT